MEAYEMVAVGMRLGVAVSGGADSVGLLFILRDLAPRWDLRLTLVHVDHGIRGEASHADAAFVAELARDLGLPFCRKDARLAGSVGNLEQEARRTRHAYFAHLIATGTVDRVATGHTRSDQAETVLQRILRGAGPAGLCGILPVIPPGIVRPLLDLDASETREWLRARNIAWREDATNLDLSFDRNRLRHRTLPALRLDYNPKLDEALAGLAELARGDEEYWSAAIPAVPTCGPAAIFKLADLNAVPVALARRWVRAAIGRVKRNLHRIESAHVEAVLAMSRLPAGGVRAQLPGLEVRRSFEWLRIAPSGLGEPAYSLPVSVPGSILLPDGANRLDFHLSPQPVSADSHDRVRAELDWKRLTHFAPASLEVRNWRPGDEYRRLGDLHGRKIKLLFQHHRIPSWERRTWPVFASGEIILWSRLFGPAADFAAAPATRERLVIVDTAAESLVTE